jgi:hypothetical protein
MVTIADNKVVLIMTHSPIFVDFGICCKSRRYKVSVCLTCTSYINTYKLPESGDGYDGKYKVGDCRVRTEPVRKVIQNVGTPTYARSVLFPQLPSRLALRKRKDNRNNREDDLCNHHRV